MNNLSFTFYNASNELITPQKSVIQAIDFTTAAMSTEWGKGERDLTFVAFTDNIDNYVLKFFREEAFFIEFYLDSTMIWAGYRGGNVPQYDSIACTISLTFVGYYAMLDERLLNKMWVDSHSVDRLRELPSRQTNLIQKEGEITPSNAERKIKIVLDNKLLNRGDLRFYTEYKTKGAYPIKKIEGQFYLRSGEGMLVVGHNPVGPLNFLTVDLSTTGDQINGVTAAVDSLVSVVPTNLTDLYQLNIGTSLEVSTIELYGDGVAELTNPLQATQDAHVLPFEKSFSWSVLSSVKIRMRYLAAGTSVTAAVYDDNKEYLGTFDNSVNLAATMSDVIFTSAGGIDIGSTAAAGKLFYIVVLVSNAPVDNFIEGTFSATNPPNATYVTNGYERVAILGGSFPASFTDSIPVTYNWVTMQLNLTQRAQDIYDQNDTVDLLDLTTKLLYHPDHDQYQTESYLGDELLQDIVLEKLPEYDPDFTDLPANINGGLPLESITSINAKPETLRSLIDRIIAVYDGGEYGILVYAANNGGTPKLAIKDKTNIPAPFYTLDTKSESVDLRLNYTNTIYNYIYATYIDPDGIDGEVSPLTDPTLKDTVSISRYGQRDYHYDAGEMTEAEATTAAKGFLAQYKQPRPGGTITVSGGNAVKFANHPQVSISPALVRAGESVVLVGYTDALGVIDPIYLIHSTNWDAGTNTLLISFESKTVLQNILGNLKARRNTNM